MDTPGQIWRLQKGTIHCVGRADLEVQGDKTLERKKQNSGKSAVSIKTVGVGGRETSKKITIIFDQPTTERRQKKGKRAM